MKKLTILFTTLIFTQFIYFQWYKINYNFQSPGAFQMVNQNIVLEISSNKSIFYEDEPIFITVKAKNTGMDIDSLPLFDEFEISESLDIRDELGNKLSFKPPGFPTYLKITPNIILPGEEIYVETIINDGFGNLREPRGGACNPSHYFSLGNYTVQCFFKDFQSSELSSNKIIFKVIPADSDEVEALTKVREIYLMPDRSSNDEEKKFETYKNFFYTYTSSVYTEEAFDYMLMSYFGGNLGSKEDMLKEMRYFIDKYPNSMFVHSVLVQAVTIIQMSTNDKQAKNFLKEIMDKYPNTKAYKEAKKIKKERY